MAKSTFTHGLYYPDNHSITLSDIAATLLAHERLAPVVADLLERSVQGLTVQKILIDLDELRKSSLLETFFVAIFVVFQKDLQEEVPDAITSLTGIEVSDRYDTLVTVLFLLLIYYGASKLLSKKEKADYPLNPFDRGYREYVLRAAGQLGVEPAKIEQAVAGAAGPKRLPVVMRATIDLFRPAKRGSNGRIVPRGLPEIPDTAVAEFPGEIALAELDDDTVALPFPDARLTLRAVDRDKSTSGWAGILEAENLRTKRLPVRLYPTVDRNALAALDTAFVEAIVESKVNETGGTTPKRIHVLRITGI